MKKRSQVSEGLCRLVDSIALAATRKRNVVDPPEAADNRWASSLIRPGRRLVCVHPGAGSEAKQWPPEHFAVLIDRLVADHGVDVVLVGGDDETHIADEVLSLTYQRDAVQSVVGALGLSELPTLLGAAALFVGNDSGPKHIAAGLGVPTVGVHSGVIDAREWGPLGPQAVAVQRDMCCKPCYIASADQCPRGLVCLTNSTTVGRLWSLPVDAGYCTRWLDGERAAVNGHPCLECDRIQNPLSDVKNGACRIRRSYVAPRRLWLGR